MYLCKWTYPQHCKYGPLHRSVDCCKVQNWPRAVICELRSIAWHRRGGGEAAAAAEGRVFTCWRVSNSSCFGMQSVETLHSTSGAGFVSLTLRFGQWQQASQLCRALFLACRAKVFRSPNRYGVHSFSYGQRRQSCQGRNHSETLARTWTDRCRTTTAPWWGNTRERRCPRQQRLA